MTSHNADEVKQKGDAWRGKSAWHMQVIDLLVGHELLGFDYVINGDLRPVKAVS